MPPIKDCGFRGQVLEHSQELHKGGAFGRQYALSKLSLGIRHCGGGKTLHLGPGTHHTEQQFSNTVLGTASDPGGSSRQTSPLKQQGL